MAGHPFVIEAAGETLLHLSAVTPGEVQAGIELTREQDAPKAAEIETWLDSLAASRQVLPKGRAAIVLPGGSLFGEGVKTRLKEQRVPEG